MENIIFFIKKRSNFIIYAILKVLTMALSLVANILVVRQLSVTDYGVFSIVSMLLGLITTFGFSWSSSSILYYGSKEKSLYGTLNKTFWARNIIIFFSLILTTILFILFDSQINRYIGIDVSYFLLIWLYISVLENYLSQYFLAVKKQLRSVMLSATAKLVYILLILLISFDVKTLIILNIISHVIVVLYIFGIDRKDIGKFEFDKSWFKQVLNFSLWQLFGFSGLYLINYGDIAVINHFMTKEDVGIYNVAYQLFMAISSFAFVISDFYASNVSMYVAKNKKKQLRSFFYKERWYINALSIIAHIVIIVMAEFIITILYGERYTESVQIFRILMIGSIFRYLSVFYMLYYNTNNKHKVLQAVNIARALLNVLLSIVFILFFGLTGVAVGTVAAILISLLFSVWYCEKRIFVLCGGKESV